MSGNQHLENMSWDYALLDMKMYIFKNNDHSTFFIIYSIESHGLCKTGNIRVGSDK